MIGGLLWMFFAATAVAASLLVALSKNILHCAFGLLAALVSVCAMYIFLGADFLAMTQVVVYVGGILVLILFGVMMTHRQHARSLLDELVQPVAAGDP
jgi:NADH-quinone oxidoreductase subunit J